MPEIKIKFFPLLFRNPPYCKRPFQQEIFANPGKKRNENCGHQPRTVLILAQIEKRVADETRAKDLKDKFGSLSRILPFFFTNQK